MNLEKFNTKTQSHEDTKIEASHQIIGACIKAVEKYHLIYETQVLTYLRLTGIKLGLFVNFGASHAKDGISRIINGAL